MWVGLQTIYSFWRDYVLTSCPAAWGVACYCHDTRIRDLSSELAGNNNNNALHINTCVWYHKTTCTSGVTFEYAGNCRGLSHSDAAVEKNRDIVCRFWSGTRRHKRRMYPRQLRRMMKRGRSGRNPPGRGGCHSQSSTSKIPSEKFYVLLPVGLIIAICDLWLYAISRLSEI